LDSTILKVFSNLNDSMTLSRRQAECTRASDTAKDISVWASEMGLIACSLHGLAVLWCSQKAGQLLIMWQNIIKKSSNSGQVLQWDQLWNHTDLLLFSLCACSFLFIYLLLTSVLPKFRCVSTMNLNLLWSTKHYCNSNKNN